MKLITWAIVNVVRNTCAVLTMTCQNVCGENLQLPFLNDNKKITAFFLLLAQKQQEPCVARVLRCTFH